MEIKKILFCVFLMAVSNQGRAVKIAPYDFALELKNADEIALIRVAKAECKDEKKVVCANANYNLDLLENFKGNVNLLKPVEAKGDLLIGSRYLFYRVKRSFSGYPDQIANVFIPISSQPFFDGDDWTTQDWLYLPKSLSAADMGASELPADKCYVGVGQGVKLRICEVASIIELKRVILAIKLAK